MKKLFFLFSIITSSLTFSMHHSQDQEAAKNRLQERYAQLVSSSFKPTTRIFMQQNPTADESKILQRYVAEVVRNAMNTRKKDLPLNTIGQEYLDALKSTAVEAPRCEWILTGEEPVPGLGYPAADCSDAWKAKQKKIEDKIAQQ